MWLLMLSRFVSPIHVAPGCCSSSLPECLCWTHPLSFVAPSFDWSLSSWAPFFPLQVSVPTLPPPPYLRASLDSGLESSGHRSNP
jgi:hypothetical protein